LHTQATLLPLIGNTETATTETATAITETAQETTTAATTEQATTTEDLVQVAQELAQKKAAT
jgi:hypothetical protein